MWEPKSDQIKSNHDVWFNANDIVAGPLNEDRLKDLFVTWQERERFRIRYGINTPVFWLETDGHPLNNPDLWDRHCFYFSNRVYGQIALTNNDLEGNRDVQRSIPVGRFITRFYPDMKPTEVKRYVDEWNAKYDRTNVLSFTDDPEEIVRIYRNGPDSCMSHSVSSYHTWDGLHPVQAYGAPGDLSLAYLGTPTSVVARAIVDQKKKYYVRAYGNAERLQYMLEAQGYTRKSRYDYGTRLNLHMSSNGTDVICPYIDCSSGIGLTLDRENNFLVMSPSGPGCATTSGFVKFPRPVRCHHCNKDINPEDNSTYLNIRGNRVCMDCVDIHYDYCDFEGEWFVKGSRVFVNYIDKYGHRGRCLRSAVSRRSSTYQKDSPSHLGIGEPTYVHTAILTNINPHGDPFLVSILDVDEARVKFAHLLKKESVAVEAPTQLVEVPVEVKPTLDSWSPTDWKPVRHITYTVSRSSPHATYFDEASQTYRTVEIRDDQAA